MEYKGLTSLSTPPLSPAYIPDKRCPRIYEDPCPWSVIVQQLLVCILSLLKENSPILLGKRVYSQYTYVGKNTLHCVCKNVNDDMSGYSFVEDRLLTLV